MKCPGCGSREDLIVQYESRHPLTYDDKKDIYIQEPGEEELILIECEVCGETFSDENFMITEKRVPAEKEIYKTGKRIFVSHPFASDPQGNRRKVYKILDELHLQHPEITFVSPLHLFSYMNSETPEQRKNVMAICYELILMSDEVWSYGHSEGCQDEKQFAIKNGIPYKEMV